MMDELADDRGPFLLGLVAADAVGGQPGVAQRSDAVGVRSAQHVDDVLDAEALVDAVYTGQGLLRVDRGIEGFWAEFVNYKNRVQRDREANYNSMKGDVIRKMLPVLDDLERSLAHRPENDSWADGMELIARKYRSVLEAEGVTRIDAVGQPFDPNFHEAISSEPNEDVESGHVIEVVQNGYMLGERVIRPAMVRVAQ